MGGWRAAGRAGGVELSEVDAAGGREQSLNWSRRGGDVWLTMAGVMHDRSRRRAVHNKKVILPWRRILW
jgi:hypothetical protein